MKKTCLCTLLFLLLSIATVTACAELEIHYLDVGQGDCAILLCDGHIMMIDGGGSNQSQFIYSYLHNTLGVSTIDIMVSTHPHNDHTGGLSAALNACKVETIYSPVFFYDEIGFTTLRRIMSEHNMNFTIPIAGNEVSLGDAKVEFLAPYMLHSKMNDNSIIVRVVYGQTSFIFMGDAEIEEEQELLASGYDLHSTVIKIGHHGSVSSSSSELIEAVNPEYAVISVGKENTYGHPNTEVLQRLIDREVSIWRTDLYGTIICSSDGQSVLFASDKDPSQDTVDGFVAFLPDEEMQNEDRLLNSTINQDEDNLSDISQLMIGIIDTSDTRRPDTVPDTIAYVGNKKSKKFHYPDCQGAQNMKEKNRIEFENREDAVALGYEPCGSCHP